MFLECTKLKIYIYWIFRIVYNFKKKLCTLNVQNYVHSLRNCVRWMYRIMYIFLMFCIFWKYRIAYILWKFVYLECTELCKLFEKIYVHSINKIMYITYKILHLECTNCVPWMYIIEILCTIVENFCMLNI